MPQYQPRPRHFQHDQRSGALSNSLLLPFLHGGKGDRRSCRLAHWNHHSRRGQQKEAQEDEVEEHHQGRNGRQDPLHTRHCPVKTVTTYTYRIFPREDPCQAQRNPREHS